jgi:hypothetical protein
MKNHNCKRIHKILQTSFESHNLDHIPRKEVLTHPKSFFFFSGPFFYYLYYYLIIHNNIYNTVRPSQIP